MTGEATNNDLEFLTATIERAATTIWKSLDWYWPAFGVNGIGESNAVIAMIRGLDQQCNEQRDCSVQIYGESPYFKNNVDNSEDNKNARLDLLFAIHDSNAVRFTCAMEAKRLFDPSGAKSMKEDICRLRGFQLDSTENNEGNLLAVSERHYGLVVALTQHEDIATWWSDNSTGQASTERPGKKTSKVWGTLRKRLTKAVVGGALNSADECAGGHERYFNHEQGACTLYLLYAIFDPSSQACRTR